MADAVRDTIEWALGMGCTLAPAARKALDGERVVEVGVDGDIFFRGGAAGQLDFWTLEIGKGRYAIRRIEPERAKVRPWAVRQKLVRPGLLTYLICPQCGFLSVVSDDQRKYPPDKCPWAACEQPWGEPRELPSDGYDDGGES